MAFSMHSHSGEFCPGHAHDKLEDIVRHAISVGYKTIGLTEHMPRYEARDLYPDEMTEDSEFALQALASSHQKYLVEAQRLRNLYQAEIHILIGFEAEFIRPSYAPKVRSLADDSCIDYFIGSLHHVHGIPIDYDSATYASALAAANGSEETLFQEYYDLQYAMLQALGPRIVGHFDLIRLMSSDPGRDIRQWAAVWQRVKRNLGLILDQGGWLECNTAALRKGLQEPYPCRPIAEEWLRMGGKFTFSDDSHGIAHVATNYARGISYLKSLGVDQVWTFRRCPSSAAKGPPQPVLAEVPVSLEEFGHPFL